MRFGAPVVRRRVYVVYIANLRSARRRFCSIEVRWAVLGDYDPLKRVVHLIWPYDEKARFVVAIANGYDRDGQLFPARHGDGASFQREDRKLLSLSPNCVSNCYNYTTPHSRAVFASVPLAAIFRRRPFHRNVDTTELLIDQRYTARGTTYREPTKGPAVVEDRRGIRAFIRDLKGKPAIHAGITGQSSRQVCVNVEGEILILTANEWDSLPVWGGPLPAGVVSRYL